MNGMGENLNKLGIKGWSMVARMRESWRKFWREVLMMKEIIVSYNIDNKNSSNENYGD